MKLGAITIEWWAVVAFLAVCCGLAAVLFDRYNYYDYRQSKCEAGTYSFMVDLVGSYSEGKNERKSPYYLRMELVSSGVMTSAPLQLAELRLVSENESKSLINTQGEVLLFDDGESTSYVVLIPSIDLLYVDYELVGTVGKVGNAHGETLSCKLKRNENHEWRIPLLDAFLSA